MNKENHFDKHKTNQPIPAEGIKYFESITHAEINKYLYGNLIISVISIFIIATISFWVLSGSIEKTSLAIWYGSTLIILALRIGMLIWFRKTKHEIKLQNYQYNLFILGSSLSAILWGILGSFLMPESILHQTFIIIMVSGIVAGSTISLGARFLASVLYMFFSMFPIIIWEGIQALKGHHVYLEIFIAMIVYLFYFNVTAYRNSSLIHNNIYLKHQNLSLLEKLNKYLFKIELFSQMAESLDKCRNDKEIGKTCNKYLTSIFPEFSGAIFLLNEANEQLKALEVWGDFALNEKTLDVSKDEFLEIIHNREHYINYPESSEFAVCIPLRTPLECYGILHLKVSSGMTFQEEDFASSDKTLITRIATNISFALSTIRYQKLLQMEAVQDTLTGLYNRRYLDDYFKVELARYERKTIPISILMIDIDHFKKFNDQYGHETGDSILHELGLFLKRSVRGSDFACRYGGEEFMLILPESGLEIACKRAENIREGVKHISILKDGKSISGITVSIGVAIFPEQGGTQASVIEAADKALYRAKEEGRDRVCIATS